MSSSSERDLAQSSAKDRKLVPFDVVSTHHDGEENYHDHFGATRNDANDMERMGKTQELRVRSVGI